jgi:PHD/YefM family antitoxin component YafN of YafNO toxin-antitoxin module
VRQGYADEDDGLVIGEAPIPVAAQGELTAPVSKTATLGEGFGGATIDEDTNTLTFPSGSEAWAGFANTDETVYPFVFPYGGSVSFNAATIEGGSDADVYFRFERMPHPDVEPAFNTEKMTISGSTTTSYTIDIPVQDAENTFSSLIFYIVDQDAPIVITDIVVTSNGPGAVPKSASFTEAFGGATFDGETSTYNFPSGSEAWAGFANMDESIYPLSFPNGGSISFTGALPTSGSDTAVNFRFERLPHPDVDPAFSTVNVIISGTDEVTYTVNFDAQGENTFRSLLLYIVDQDSPVIIKDVVVTAHVADKVYAPAEITGSFGGATFDGETSTYNFPSGSEAWAGFANENAELYPFSFPNGGTVTFTGALPADGSDTDVNFRFERLPHPDVDPAFSTANVTVSGTDEVVYTAVIPPQDAENTFRSLLMYVVDQDSPVIIKNVVVTEYSYAR